MTFTPKSFLDRTDSLNGSFLDGILPPRPPAHEEPIPEFPDELKQWLARLRLLYGVPFTYLVPEARLLPPESIRFFYLDRNWTDRLVEGALSVGRSSSRDDALLKAAVAGGLLTALDEEERNLPLKQRRAEPGGRFKGEISFPGKGKVRPRGELTGFLLRSAVVSGWPGLTIRAYRESNSAEQLPILRRDCVAPSVLLCIFQGVPKQVEIEQPHECLHFKVLKNGDYTFNDKSKISTRQTQRDVMILPETMDSTTAANLLISEPYRQVFSGDCTSLGGGMRFGSIWSLVNDRNAVSREHIRSILQDV